ncbi:MULTISPECIES: TetR/AcrR family transcriptional regulator [Sphingobium]|uniref:TetR/AcrR family transcriptional regulator n=1 Tax=Sphingobium TaxID=165695 RepID=UPI0015EC3C3E|nr:MULTISPECIES: TetR/AcrR family transcriptional regulator [Sphingobium]
MEQTAIRGRPREFCCEQALAAALRVFWTKGYEGASLSELTDAMGITRPSLYAAFGNKEALFRQALDLYEREKLAYIGPALDMPTARGVAQHLLDGALSTIAGNGQPTGCLSVISVTACGAEAQSIREEVLKRGETVKRALVARMQRAIDEGEFVGPADAEAITKYLIAVLQGMAVLAGSGTTREELERVAETTMGIWPSR